MPVFLNNVDDYLGPSQACVNPLFTAPSKSAPESAHGSYNKNSASGSATGGTSDRDDDGTKKDHSNFSNRRRTRRRHTPRVIKSDENETLDSNVVQSNGGPLRLVHDSLDDATTSHPAPSPEVPSSEFSSESQTIKKKKKATVTLSDCLSCSGCVTSAEAVLMSHHSVEKLREVAFSLKLNQPLQKIGKFPNRKMIFTISPASLADLYRHLYLKIYHGTSVENDEVQNSITRESLLRKVAAFLHSEFGAAMVIDGVVSQRISLMEAASEFCYRFKNQLQMKSDDDNKNNQSNTMTSIALSSTETRFIDKMASVNSSVKGDEVMEVVTLRHPPGRIIDGDEKCNYTATEAGRTPSDLSSLLNSKENLSLPMLASSCPGFVCLVEKTAPAVVPLLSSSKSPMAVAGTLLKAGLWDRDSPDEVFHVAIMPCHDKKLEAGRADFAWERQALMSYGGVFNQTNNINSSSGMLAKGQSDYVNEVDLVLTTGELLEVLSDAASRSKSKNHVGGDISMAESNNNKSSALSAFAIRDFLETLTTEPDDNLDDRDSNLVTETFDENDTRPNDEPQSSTGNLDDSGVHGSGSYADYIFRYAAWNLFGCELPLNEPLPWKSSTTAASSANAAKTSGVLRRRKRRQETTDMREVSLYKLSDGSYSCDAGNENSIPVLTFATAYGFKNVQLVLQNLSKNNVGMSESPERRRFDYVEIMACPSGCPNGGGQIGSAGQRETPRETKERVKETVSAVPIIRPKSNNRSIAFKIYGNSEDVSGSNGIISGGCFGHDARRLFHTRFHAVPKMEISSGAAAGVAVSDTNW
mmetsp:Transcript_23520/g.48187  ORF Transcript_23520/g.48187 Transcript_23520/m.48187 type:complete len:810 (-) Transcript_23520:37-2466(-)